MGGQTNGGPRPLPTAGCFLLCESGKYITHKRKTQLAGHLEAKGICIPGSAQDESKIGLLAARDCKESSNIFKLQNCQPGEGDGQTSLLYPARGGAYPPLFPLRAHQNHFRTRSLHVV